MRQLSYLIGFSLCLLSCIDKAAQPAELQLKLEYVGGSRARFSVACTNKDIYYTYTIVGENSENFTDTDYNIAMTDIEFMKESAQYLDEGVSIADVFLYRGSRQFTMTTMVNDTDFRFIIYQVHPKTFKIIGETISVPFHTSTVTERDLSFEVLLEGDELTIIPSDPSLPYIWDYENKDLIQTNYFTPYYYAYSLVGMYNEYGFLDSMLSQGSESWNFTEADPYMQEGEECVLVIAGCEAAEFTTIPVQILFRYQKGNVEVLDWEYSGF